MRNHLEPTSDAKVSASKRKRSGFFGAISRKLRRSRQLPVAIFVAVFAISGVSLLVLTRAATNVNSVKDGVWSDPTVWSTGRVPEVGDTVTISANDQVTYDLATSPVLAETYIRGMLTFDPNKDTKLVTSRNMVVTGRLVMRPANAEIEQFIQLASINENAFVGGGMEVLPEDIGIWVMDTGILDIAGTPKLAWTNLTDGVSAGATNITLQQAPSGWRVGDTVIITPTEPPTVGSASHTATEERTITAISGNTITLNTGLNRAHPKVNNMWTAEIGNLTRNVRIEGTQSGSGHIFIHSTPQSGAENETRPQTIAHAQLRYMSAAGVVRQQERAAPLLGRYAVHFHHNNDLSRGSIVDGVVVREAGQHSFVPHSSHGVTMRNNIAYNVKGDAFWWDEHGLDPKSDSHDTVWDRNLVAKMDNWLAGGIRTAGFLLGAGHNNIVTNSVVAGTIVTSESSGYTWDNDDIGVWLFDNNKAHNGAANGISVWQNAVSPHVHAIGGFAIYYNREFGISHGAYANDYRYFNGYVYGNGLAGVDLLANSFSPLHQRWENIVWDGAGITPTLVLAGHSSVDSTEPTLFINSTFRGYTKNAVELFRPGPTGDPRKNLDIINSTFEGPTPAILFGEGASDNLLNRVRVQPTTGRPYQIGPNNVRTNINKFMPSFYGTGNGLLSEFFLGTSIPNGRLVRSRVDPTISDGYNDEGNHKPLPWLKPWPTPFINRWTGQFQAQETGPYTFIRDKHMGMRVWLSGQPILDAWNSSPNEVRSTTVNLVQGQKYDFRAEGNFTAGVDWQDFRLFVEGPSQPRLTIPMGQLYCTNPICNFNSGQQTPIPTPTPTPPAPTPPPTPADTTAPTVSITAPANNASISGTVNVTANASDNVGVTQVEFLVDGQVRTTDNSSPYGFSLNTTNPSLSNGTHTIAARARDAAGNTRTSSNVTVTVNNTAPTPPSPTPTPPPPAPTFLAEDLDQNGKVNVFDYSLLLSKYGQQGPGLGRADINNDNKVNIFDYSQLLTRYGYGT